MNLSRDDLQRRLASAADAEAERRREEIEGLLAEIERFAAWQALDLPPDLRGWLADRERDVGVQVARKLAEWRRLGGRFTLGFDGPHEIAAPAPTVESVVRPNPIPLPTPVSLPAPVPAEDSLEDETPTEHILHGKPPVREAPPANLASADALASLKAHVEGGGHFRVQAPAADWPARLGEQLDELLPYREPEADLPAVLRVVDAVEKWRHLPPEVQATLVGLLAARLRALQEFPGFLGDRRVDYAFGSLSAYVKRARPGFVYGLARWHTPNRGSWEADAEALYERLASMIPSPAEQPNQQRQLETIEGLVRELDIAPVEARSAVASQLRAGVLEAFRTGLSARNARLVRILAPVADLFDGPEFRTLRRALRDEADATRSDEDAESGGEEAPLPAEWPWWGFTRGKRALIIGGDPREPNRVRLEKAFEFASLEWVGAEYKRNNLLGVRDRVRAGRTDLVILLTRFTGHDADQIVIPACREMGVGFVCVQHGYGVVRVRQAIERFLDPAERR